MLDFTSEVEKESLAPRTQMQLNLKEHTVITVVVQDGVVGPGLAARQAPRTGSHGRLVYLSNLVITFCKILETLANGLARVQVVVSVVGQYAPQFGP